MIWKKVTDNKTWKFKLWNESRYKMESTEIGDDFELSKKRRILMSRRKDSLELWRLEVSFYKYGHLGD